MSQGLLGYQAGVEGQQVQCMIVHNTIHEIIVHILLAVSMLLCGAKVCVLTAAHGMAYDFVDNRHLLQIFSINQTTLTMQQQIYLRAFSASETDQNLPEKLGERISSLLSQTRPVSHPIMCT